MNTLHEYSLQFPQVDTLVFYPQLDHLNDNLISVTWGKSGVMRGLAGSMGPGGSSYQLVSAGGSSAAG